MALDLGDQWIGVALTDATGIFVRPYQTVPAVELDAFLAETLKNEPIDRIVVGYPKTLKGGESEQTRKIVAQKEMLEKKFPQIPFVLWDERLSSKRAQEISTRKTTEQKLRVHALAAAFILDSYITYLQIHTEAEE